MKLFLSLTHLMRHLVWVWLGLVSLLAQGQYSQTQKITANPRESGAVFGGSVAVDGAVMVVGAYNESGGGAAYVYELSGGTWTQTARLVANDRAAGDYFGVSVGISGTTLVVGAVLEDEDASGGNSLDKAGSAYVFEKSGSTWTQTAKLVANDRAESDYFGTSVGISGSTIVVGANSDNEDASGGNTLNRAGSAYVFEKSGSTWTQTQKLVASDRAAEDFFGNSVGISGSTLVVAAVLEDEDASGGNRVGNAGSAYVFEKSGSTWSQTQKLVANDRGVGDYFGTSVAISGGTIVVGAFFEDQDASGGNTLTDAGSAYVFEKSGSTWTQTQKLVANDRAADDYFGRSVAISGSTIVVGSIQEDEDASGGNTLGQAGSAYVFEKSGSTWTQTQKLVANVRAEFDSFGYSVGISGSTLVVGALGEDEDASGSNTLGQAGSAYVFGASGVVCTVSGSTAYVNAAVGSSGDGSGWGTAFKTLQEALAAANTCPNITQIWVAKGTYYPDEGPGQTNNARTSSFSMKNGVAIYGGFAGNEAANFDLSLRNFSTNPTILSGDIDGVPDVVTGSGSSLSITGNAGNAIHVIFNQSGLTNSAILDGFTVSGGNANGTSPNNRGGGMLNDGSGTGNFCSPTLRNCIFLHNNASFAGGGVYNRGVGANTATDIGESSPLFSNCTFTANNSIYGGAIYQDGSGSTSYTNCVFTYNRASYGGAIAYSTSATATAAHTILTCSFTGNYAGIIGGAIQSGFSYETGTRTVSMTNCSFTDNVAPIGGGAFSNGLGLSAGNTPVFFTNCVFKNNVAHNGSTIGTGGAFQSQGGLTSQRATFTNCLLEGNRALGTADDGGGAIMIYSGTVTLLNSTLTNNQTATRGGGISIQNNTGSVSSKNTILWNNTATTANTNSIANGNGGSATVGYSLLQEAACPANVTCGAGMIYNQDPRFVNPASGNFQLAPCSPAINAGTNAGAPGTDLLGNSRPLTVANPADLGAYEFQGTPGFSVSITPGGPTTFCAGGSVTLSVGTFSSYVWKNGDVQVSTDPTYVATAPGSYTVTVTDANGCNGTSSPVVVNVNPLPVVSITGLEASYCKNAAAVTLTGSPAGGSFTVDGNPATSLNPASLSVGPHSVVYAYTDAN
ncbi:MAG: hypothetical protein LH606_05620, partial [Cytophagaceae bacterium]|nr:hypothetical protein [Cytophagaceae bacterium]